MSDESKAKIGAAIKGQTPWNKGLEMPEEFKSKVAAARKGKKHSKAVRAKMRESHLGRLAGERNHNWLGGKSFEPYGIKFNASLKEEIKERDNHTCQVCGGGRNLAIHHIDYDKTNNEKKNLISLCLSCHSKTNFDREYWQNAFQSHILGKVKMLENMLKRHMIPCYGLIIY